MTLDNLKRPRYLQIEIQHCEEKIAELRTLSEKTTQTVSDMPHASGTSDKVGTLACIIADYRSFLENVIAKRLKERHNIHKLFQGIPDPQTRDIFILRYIDCLEWQDIAAKIGGGNTAGSVIMRARRYLESVDESEIYDI